MNTCDKIPDFGKALFTMVLSIPTIQTAEVLCILHKPFESIFFVQKRTISFIPYLHGHTRITIKLLVISYLQDLFPEAKRVNTKISIKSQLLKYQHFKKPENN